MKREKELKRGQDYKYLPEEFGLGQNSRVADALELAVEIHKRDKRKVSGEPYVFHCVAVASILESWGADEDEIIAGLLHDTVEDHSDQIDLEIIRELFGDRVAHLVDGVTKLKSPEGEKKEFETLRKVTRESLIEPGVALIKLADRLHNMLEMEGMKPEAQRKISLETIKVYAPLAESFGLWQVKKLLEDLAFPFVDPERFRKVKTMVDSDPRVNREFIANTKKEIAGELESKGISCVVEHQIGGYWEISEKQKKFGMRADVRSADFSEVTDVISFRILIDGRSDLTTCYAAMGAVRSIYPGKLIREWHNDYLIEPATNRYSSVHDSYRFDEGCVEVAITTLEREEFNNWGVSSLKKDELNGNPERYARKMMFTPKHELVFMEPNATGIDVAYKLNPLLGLRSIGIKIDGKLAGLDAIVPHASLIEVVVDHDQNEPEKEWLSYCNRDTRKMLEHQLAVVERDIEVRKGEEILISEVLAERGILDLTDIESRLMDRLLMSLGCWSGLSDLYYKVAYGFDLELIRKKMDELGIIRGMYTTVLVRGENKIGISRDIAKIIAKFGGDARSKVETVDSKERFMIRVLMTVDYKGKKKIEEELSRKYQECIVV